MAAPQGLDRQAGKEALGLANPDRNHAGGAYDERRLRETAAVEEGKDLHRLPEAHLVRQEGVAVVPAEMGEVGDAAFLVRSQKRGRAGGRFGIRGLEGGDPLFDLGGEAEGHGVGLEEAQKQIGRQFPPFAAGQGFEEIGRASCRGRV